MTLGHDEIRAEADRVLAAGSFQRSERLSRFLRFVVDGALEGKHEQLKEYVLGVEVYQKGADFDPRIDSTVRVEAARLRAKLREYYETEGRSDPVRIDLPKGGYAPLFRRAEPPTPHARPTGAPAVWIAGLLMAGFITVLVFMMRPRPEPPSATKVRPLTSWPGREIQPRFSPDGKQVAMAWSGENDDKFDVYVKPIGEGLPRRLTTDPADDGNPAWSPDGRWIAFIRDSPGGAGVYLVPAQGGAERLVARLGRAVAASGNQVLDWYPDGQALAVADRDSPEEPFSIQRIELETGAKRQLTAPPSLSWGDAYPAISPDGTLLAFAREPARGAFDLYMIPAAGGEPRRLTFEHQVIIGIAWSEDGRSIVFASERGGTAGGGSLWKMQVGSSTSRPKLEQVPGVGTRARLPAIARRGRLLAYAELSHDSNLWRVAASGIGAPELVVSSTREEVAPHYSPDGRRIAFQSNRSGNWEIWIANADGSDSRQLTTYAGAPARDPRWSPDGRLIAFAYRGESNADIYTMTPEGNSIRRLTWEPSQDESPYWSKDGRWLYFSSNRSGIFEIWKISVDHPTEAVRLTHGGGAAPLESADGTYLFFKRRNSERVDEAWKMPSNGGEAIRVLDTLAALSVQSWAIDPAGIYFIEPFRRIAYYRFATGRVTTVVPLGKHAWVNGLAPSPDGRWLLYGQRDREVSDIMLVENFQ